MHSARRGLGSDVAGSRPYLPGDDMDAILYALCVAGDFVVYDPQEDQVYDPREA